MQGQTMIVHTDYLVFNTQQRQEFIRITDEIAGIVKTSGVTEGTVLVSAMHITAGVFVNDWEEGLIDDFQLWLDRLAPAGSTTSITRRVKTTPPHTSNGRSPGTKSWCRSPTANSISAPGSSCSMRNSTGSAGSGSS